MSRWKVLCQIFVGFLIMLLAELVSSLCCDLLFSNIITAPLPKWGYLAIRAVAVILTTYGLLYLYIRKIFKSSMSRFRMGKGHIKPLYIVCAVALPIFVILCLTATGGAWIDNQHDIEVIVGMVFIALAYGLRAGIIEELIFRGYMMTLIEQKWGKWIAIIIPSVIFGLLHVTSMTDFNPSSFLLLLVAGTSVGIMFSLVTYDNGSIWASVIIHVIWNMVIIGGVLDSSTVYNTNSAFSLVLNSNQTVLTGGSFGVEASIFAIIGYITVIAIAMLSLKRKMID